MNRHNRKRQPKQDPSKNGHDPTSQLWLPPGAQGQKARPIRGQYRNVKNMQILANTNPDRKVIGCWIAFPDQLMSFPMDKRMVKDAISELQQIYGYMVGKGESGLISTE